MTNQIVKNIFAKWYREYKHGHFTTYKDGDITNDKEDNIGYVSIKEAFKKNLIFNWTFGLNKEEIEYVNTNFEYFRDY